MGGNATYQWRAKRYIKEKITPQSKKVKGTGLEKRGEPDRGCNESCETGCKTLGLRSDFPIGPLIQGGRRKYCSLEKQKGGEDGRRERTGGGRVSTPSSS